MGLQNNINFCFLILLHLGSKTPPSSPSMASTSFLHVCSIGGIWGVGCSGARCCGAKASGVCRLSKLDVWVVEAVSTCRSAGC